MKKKTPTTAELLSTIEIHAPAVSWIDENQTYIGIVRYFDLEATRLRINFKWIILNHRILLVDHNTIFKNPKVTDAGDYLSVEHEGGNGVIITNLAKYKVEANTALTRIEKRERIRQEVQKQLANQNHR